MVQRAKVNLIRQLSLVSGATIPIITSLVNYLQYILYINTSKPKIRHDFGAYLATISRGIHIFLNKSDKYKLVVWEAFY